MPRREINQISVLLLVIGLGCAYIIYTRAIDLPSDPQLDDPRNTKKYVREMQVIGGNANLVVSDFQDWFMGLWHGKNLAGTVTVLTLCGTSTFWLLATHPKIPD